MSREFIIKWLSYSVSESKLKELYNISDSNLLRFIYQLGYKDGQADPDNLLRELSAILKKI